MQDLSSKTVICAIVTCLLWLIFANPVFSDEQFNKSGWLDGELEDRSIIYQPDANIPGQAMQEELPVKAGSGPHLLLDDYLIAESRNVKRVIMQPQRDPTIPNPIVTGPEDGCFQPYLTVLRDGDTGRYRIWYDARREDKSHSHARLATMESPDGIHFIRPPRICVTPEIKIGSEVIDRGTFYPEPSARYVYSYWTGGMRLLASPDGYNWHMLVDSVVLFHDHDITGIDWDPIRRVYVASVSTNRTERPYLITTGKKWSGYRRTTMMSLSKDLLNWEKPWFVLTPNDKLDEGQTQFYSMDGYLSRGGLRIGMAKILRDDLHASDTEPGSYGRSHTCLAWSRDGRNWVRDRGKFFEPDDNPKSWDHAHAWIDEQLIVGDEVYLYYSGYKQGHKVNRFEERQIGLVKMPLDRYVARRSEGSKAGVIKTVPIKLGQPAGILKVNADATGGQLRLQIRDAVSGKVIKGLSFDKCVPITSNGLRQPVQWRGGDLSALTGKEVRIEFEMNNASLFAFEFVQ